MQLGDIRATDVSGLNSCNFPQVDSEIVWSSWSISLKFRVVQAPVGSCVETAGRAPCSSGPQRRGPPPCG